MYQCPVCGKSADTMKCEECGYDISTHYEQLPTLMYIQPGIDSVYTVRRKSQEPDWDAMQERNSENFEKLILYAHRNSIAAMYKLSMEYLEGVVIQKDVKRAIFWLEKAAEQGNFLAQLELGKIYSSGDNVPENSQKVSYWLEKAVAQVRDIGDAELVGKAYFDAEDYDSAVIYFSALEEKSNVIIELLIQCCKHEISNYLMVIPCLSAEQLVDIGTFWNRELSYATALIYFKSASEFGNADAMYYLGLYYLYGYGVDADWKSAVEYLLDSAERGNPDARTVLCTNHFYKCYFKFDDNLLRLAALGEPRAQYQVGKFYWLGRGIEQCHAEAFRWFERSARQEWTDAQLAVAICYYTGQGIAADREKACKYFLNAAENGNIIAQYDLGCIYLYGIQALQNSFEGTRWLEKAADRGYLDAMNNLACYYYNEMRGHRPTKNSWKKIWSAASAKGNQNAVFNLAIAYEYEGKSTESRQQLKKAAELGDGMAKNILENRCTLPRRPRTSPLCLDMPFS